MGRLLGRSESSRTCYRSHRSRCKVGWRSCWRKRALRGAGEIWKRFVGSDRGQPRVPPSPPSTPAGQPRGGANSPHHLQAHQVLGQYLAGAGHLSPARKQEYRQAAFAVFDLMTPQAMERFNRHLRGYRLFENLFDLNCHFSPHLPRQQVQAFVGLNLLRLGAYNTSTGEIEADGGNRFAGRTFSTQYVFAHEFGHAVDGPNSEISATQEWQDAWSAEIVPAYPGTTAALHPAEGFSRFSQVVHESGLPRPDIEAQFPRCTDLWRHWRLW